MLLTSSGAEVVASDLAFPNSAATLSRLHATLPELRLTKPAPTAETLLLESPDARFEALLAESAANTLWILPGQVNLLEDIARLTVGPFSLDLRVYVEGDRVVLEPEVPPLIQAVIGPLPPVSLRPDLPLGAVIQEVELKPGTLILRGSSQKLQVPLQPQTPKSAAEAGP